MATMRSREQECELGSEGPTGHSSVACGIYVVTVVIVKAAATPHISNRGEAFIC